MSYKTFVIVTLCAITGSLVTGRPQKRDASINTIDLERAVNRTLCPIIVKTDTVDGRIPRDIKMIMCNKPAIEECPAKQGEENCCKIVGKTLRQCYQLQEYVPVKYDKDPTISTFLAQVGCACMNEKGAEAQEVSG